MRTEDDAKANMTCYRSIGVAPVYHPTDGQGICDGGPWTCLGSVCSAWRWGSKEYRNSRVCAYDNDHPHRWTKEEPPRPADLPASWVFVGTDEDGDPACWREPQEDADKRRKGYCGAAGPWS